MICQFLFEDFKRFFLEMGSSVVNSSLYKKARFVSIFGYSYQINLYDELKNFIIDHLKNSVSIISNVVQNSSVN